MFPIASMCQVLGLSTSQLSHEVAAYAAGIAH